MALSPQKFREIVFQLLYSQDIGQPEPSLMTDLMMGKLSVSKKNVKMAQERVCLIQGLLPKIDSLINSISTSYDFNRIQTVTKNILRLGVFELFFDDAIPPKVAIAEAIRLSRKFNTPESASFVNALLDHLYQQSQGEQADLHHIEEEARELIESERCSSEAAQQQAHKDSSMGDAFTHDHP